MTRIRVIPRKHPRRLQRRAGRRSGKGAGEGRSDAEFELIHHADAHTNVALSVFTDCVNSPTCSPLECQVPALGMLMDQVANWSTALAPLREVRQAA